MRRLALPVCLLAASLLTGPAAAATAPLGKARAAAAKRLFAYVYPMSYVIDYRLTDCTRDGATITCGYSIGFYAGESCTGTIAVEPVGRKFTTKVVGTP